MRAWIRLLKLREGTRKVRMGTRKEKEIVVSPRDCGDDDEKEEFSGQHW